MVAFAITQAVEIPVYLWFSRRLPVARRWIHAVGASTLTHPVVWFAVPWQQVETMEGYWKAAAVAEVAVVAVESVYGRLLGVPRPVSAAVVANGASFVTGLMFQGVG